MAWTIEWATSVQKGMKKVDHTERKKIREYLENKVAVLDDPRQLGKSLTGNMSEFWRYRVGSYRIITSIQDETVKILVVRVGHRKNIYD